MLSAIRKRLAGVEECLPVPVTAERFYARAQQHASRFGGNVASAFAMLVKEPTDGQLESLAAEFEWLASGSDTAARDAAKREVFAAAGYPDWSASPAAKSEVEGW